MIISGQTGSHKLLQEHQVLSYQNLFNLDLLRLEKKCKLVHEGNIVFMCNLFYLNGYRLSQVSSRTQGRHHSSRGIFRHLQISFRKSSYGNKPWYRRQNNSRKSVLIWTGSVTVLNNLSQGWMDFCSHLLHNTSLTQDLIRSIISTKSNPSLGFSELQN